MGTNELANKAEKLSELFRELDRSLDIERWRPELFDGDSGVKIALVAPMSAKLDNIRLVIRRKDNDEFVDEIMLREVPDYIAEHFKTTIKRITGFYFGQVQQHFSWN